MRNLMIAMASVTALGCFGAASAAPVLIDFEGEAAGTVIDDEFAPLVTVSANSNGPVDQAMVFDSNNPTGGDSDLAAPFDNQNTPANDAFAPGNILIISEDGDSADPDDEADGGTISFDFMGIVEFLDIDIFDIDAGEEVSFSFYDGADVLFGAIDVSGNLIGNGGYTSLADVVLFATGQTIAERIGTTFIGRLDVTFSGSGAIDNLYFETAEIPVPAALPLLLSGIAGLGFASRRRRKHA